MKAYKERHPDKVREHARKSVAKRRKEDPAFRFRGAVSRLVGARLKRKGGRKAGLSFFISIGYTSEELRSHIEKQFHKGMTWENYGTWHLDHIVPCASFAFLSMDDPEFRACWALANLRPLWRAENLAKGDAVLTLL